MVNGDGQPDCSREQNPRGVHHYQPTHCDSTQDCGATIGVYREVDQRRRSGQDRPGEIRVAQVAQWHRAGNNECGEPDGADSIGEPFNKVVGTGHNNQDE